MPVRAIKRVSGELEIQVPRVILDTFSLKQSSSGNLFVCEFRRHFSSDRNFIHRIDRKAKLRGWCSDSKWARMDAKLSIREKIPTFAVPTGIDRNTSQNVPSVT
jgi:hypothetical protein